MRLGAGGASQQGSATGTEAPEGNIRNPTRVQTRAACFLGVLGLHLPDSGDDCGDPTLSTEVLEFLLEPNAEIVAKDFERGLSAALDNEDGSTNFLYGLV